MVQGHVEGVGEVVRVSQSPPGMGVVFRRLSPASRSLIERLCERVIILHQGRIVADAPTAELVSLSQGRSLEAVFSELTEAPQGDVAEVVRALLQAVVDTHEEATR